MEDNMQPFKVLPILALAGILAAPLAAGAAPSAAKHTAGTTKTKVAGKYLVTLLLQRPQRFYYGLSATRSDAEGGMKIRGGAKPMKADSVPHPTHFLGVIVKDKASDRTVIDADVKMNYAKAGPGQQTQMKVLPVVKMDIIGKDVESMRYGNNARLKPGRYRVHVTINGKARADFTIRVGA
jgi:hypothetical protein